jgi:hypothetical protein
MKIILIILFLAALLITTNLDAAATICIEDVATGEVWCDPGSPVSPLAQPQWVYLPLMVR